MKNQLLSPSWFSTFSLLKRKGGSKEKSIAQTVEAAKHISYWQGACWNLPTGPLLFL